MAFNPTANSPTGTGNPYYGSGFTNFDRYLQNENLDWAMQDYYGPNENDTPDNGGTFNQWMANRAAPMNPKWEGEHSPHQPLPQPEQPTPEEPNNEGGGSYMDAWKKGTTQDWNKQAFPGLGNYLRSW